MNNFVETVIIGGGQSGLAASYCLKQRGREHLVLERAAEAGNVWRNERWDSFTLSTPNWSFRLPGAVYQGDEPDGFMPRDEIVAYFESYVERAALPVRYQADVTAVEPEPNGNGYLVKMNGGEHGLRAANVIIATGLYQQPRLPGFSGQISPEILQITSAQYRSPAALPPGAVLVVGSGQSGCQIAEELHLIGRKVFLSTGGGGRAPRRYRGKDIYDWLNRSGYLDRTPDQLPSPKAKFAAIPHLSGTKGGHSLNLHQFARAGIKLLGHIAAGRDHKVWFAPDLKENLAKADQFEAEIIKMVDGFIQRSGLDALPETLPLLQDGYQVPDITELDLRAAGVTTIIYAMGFTFDFSWIKLPVVDADGYPLQQQGVSAYPGLYFVGMPWISKLKSGFLVGVGEDAENLAAHITARAKTSAVP